MLSNGKGYFQRFWEFPRDDTVTVHSPESLMLLVENAFGIMIVAGLENGDRRFQGGSIWQKLCGKFYELLVRHILIFRNVYLSE